VPTLRDVRIIVKREMKGPDDAEALHCITIRVTREQFDSVRVGQKADLDYYWGEDY